MSLAVFGKVKKDKNHHYYANIIFWGQLELINNINSLKVCYGKIIFWGNICLQLPEEDVLYDLSCVRRKIMKLWISNSSGGKGYYIYDIF